MEKGGYVEIHQENEIEIGNESEREKRQCSGSEENGDYQMNEEREISKVTEMCFDTVTLKEDNDVKMLKNVKTVIEEATDFREKTDYRMIEEVSVVTEMCFGAVHIEENIGIKEELMNTKTEDLMTYSGEESEACEVKTKGYFGDATEMCFHGRMFEEDNKIEKSYTKVKIEEEERTILSEKEDYKVKKESSTGEVAGMCICDMPFKERKKIKERCLEVKINEEPATRIMRGEYYGMREERGFDNVTEDIRVKEDYEMMEERDFREETEMFFDASVVSDDIAKDSEEICSSDSRTTDILDDRGEQPLFHSFSGIFGSLKYADCLDFNNFKVTDNEEGQNARRSVGFSQATTEQEEIKMLKECSVLHCQYNAINDGRRALFPLPEEPAVFCKWLMWIRKIHGSNFFVPADYVVCEKHFILEWFQRKGGILLLKKNAFPTISPDTHYYNYEQNVLDKEGATVVIEGDEEIFVEDGICNYERYPEQIDNGICSFERSPGQVDDGTCSYERSLEQDSHSAVSSTDCNFPNYLNLVQRVQNNVKEKNCSYERYPEQDSHTGSVASTDYNVADYLNHVQPVKSYVNSVKNNDLQLMSDKTPKKNHVKPIMKKKKARVILKELQIPTNSQELRSISSKWRRKVKSTECSVFGCKSTHLRNERIGVFHLPETHLCFIWIRWLQKFHGPDFIPGKDFVVCEKHFLSKFVIKNETLTCSDGTSIQVRRYKSMLLRNAIPSISPKSWTKNISPKSWTKDVSPKSWIKDTKHCNSKSSLHTKLHCVSSSSMPELMKASQIGNNVSSLKQRAHQKKTYTFYRDLLATDEEIFFKYLRLSKDAFNYLLDLLDLKEHSGRGNHCISATECLMVTLWFLGNKTSFKKTAAQFALARSSVQRIFYNTVNKICELHDTIIKWPSDLKTTEQNFKVISGFPGIVGAIAATHIKVTPSHENHTHYLDRTMNYSEVLLAVCDANMKYTHIATGFPGSIHEQRCLELSLQLSAAVTSPPNASFPSHDYHLAGETGFKLESTVLVPYKDCGNLSVQQKLYNTKLSKAREVIGHSFGFLKARFRCLKYLEVELQNATSIIAACCILHNIALCFPDTLSINEALEAASKDVLGNILDCQETPTQNAEEKRNRICSSL